MTVSRMLDGFPMDHYKLRFSGAVELSEAEATRVGLGEDLEMSVLVTVKDIAVRTQKGEITRVAVLNVIDARLQTPDPGQLFDPIGYEHQVTTDREDVPTSPEEWRAWVRRDDLTTVTSVPVPGGMPERTFPETDNDGNLVTVVGRIGNAEPRAVAASGPKVLPFSDETAVARVGSRDPALSRFIDESV